MGAGGSPQPRKKRILLNNIYGVDIDRAGGGGDQAEPAAQGAGGRDRRDAGPATGAVARAGPARPGQATSSAATRSSGRTSFQGRLLADDEETRRVNPFDWQAEFPEAMAAGGFDVIIGNPPYVRMEEFKETKSYLRSHYLSHSERSDLYIYFVERGLGLLQESGYFGMIVSNKLLRAKSGQKLRHYLSTVAQVDRITDFAGLPVFAGATVRTLVLVATRRKASPAAFLYTPPVPFDVFATVQRGSQTVSDAVAPFSYRLDTTSLGDGVWSLTPPRETLLLDRLALFGQPFGRLLRQSDLHGSEVWVLATLQFGQKQGMNKIERCCELVKRRSTIL